jgi:hypothetical protein
MRYSDLNHGDIVEFTFDGQVRHGIVADGAVGHGKVERWILYFHGELHGVRVREGSIEGEVTVLGAAVWVANLIVGTSPDYNLRDNVIRATLREHFPDDPNLVWA